MAGGGTMIGYIITALVSYLLGSIPVRPFPNEEAIQNDIEDLSQSLPHLRGKKAGEFLDLSLLKSMDEEGFFKRLQGK